MSKLDSAELEQARKLLADKMLDHVLVEDRLPGDRDDVPIEPVPGESRRRRRDRGGGGRGDLRDERVSRIVNSPPIGTLRAHFAALATADGSATAAAGQQPAADECTSQPDDLDVGIYLVRPRDRPDAEPRAVIVSFKDWEIIGAQS